MGDGGGGREAVREIRRVGDYGRRQLERMEDLLRVMRRLGDDIAEGVERRIEHHPRTRRTIRRTLNDINRDMERLGIR